MQKSTTKDANLIQIELIIAQTSLGNRRPSIVWLINAIYRIGPGNTGTYDAKIGLEATDDTDHETLIKDQRCLRRPP
jgi:hypothetical protein